jgi:Ran GTPase-activating protein (RanGAP) involved in mRNA processing and transport
MHRFWIQAGIPANLLGSEEDEVDHRLIIAQRTLNNDVLVKVAGRTSGGVLPDSYFSEADFALTLSLRGNFSEKQDALSKEDQQFLTELIVNRGHTVVENLDRIEIQQCTIDQNVFHVLNWIYECNSTLRTKEPEVLARGVTILSLDFSDNVVSPQEVKKLCELLPEYFPRLEHLDLSQNRLRDESAEHIAGFLKQSNTLNSLNLYFNFFSKAGALSLFEALGSSSTCEDEAFNKSLTWLNLSSNPLSDEVSHDLLKLFAVRSWVPEINIFGTRMHSDSVESACLMSCRSWNRFCYQLLCKQICLGFLLRNVNDRILERNLLKLIFQFRGPSESNVWPTDGLQYMPPLFPVINQAEFQSLDQRFVLSMIEKLEAQLSTGAHSCMVDLTKRLVSLNDTYLIDVANRLRSAILTYNSEERSLDLELDLSFNLLNQEKLLNFIESTFRGCRPDRISISLIVNGNLVTEATFSSQLTTFGTFKLRSITFGNSTESSSSCRSNTGTLINSEEKGNG